MPKTLYAKRRDILAAALALGAAGIGRAWADEGWTYRGDNGPDHWAEIDPSAAMCSDGLQQSPVDLSQAKSGALEPLSLLWRKGDVTLLNDGHSIEARMSPGSLLSRAGKTYDLARIDFHAPSEHLVDGKAYPMEAQFVHKDRQGDDLVIVSVLLLQGQLNDAFSQLSSSFPRRPGQTRQVADFSPSGLLPPDLSYWSYPGSLTTPPCSENVIWLVLTQPVRVDARDIDNFMSIAVGNARPVMPLNNRIIQSSR